MSVPIELERIVGPEMFAELREYAAANDLSIQDALTQALEEWFKSNAA